MERRNKTANLFAADLTCIIDIRHRYILCCAGEIADDTACLVYGSNRSCIEAIADCGKSCLTGKAANSAITLHRCSVIAVIHRTCDISRDAANVLDTLNRTTLDAEIFDSTVDPAEEAGKIHTRGNSQIFDCIAPAVKRTFKYLSIGRRRCSAADGNPLAGFQVNVIEQGDRLSRVSVAASDIMRQQAKLCRRT